ncbi:hypothetical protein [Actinoplanes sp. NPDC051859]|uniref:hypothetical protein n=1 Tax=Actinoplanes sp. NPDC051859 TaxID=3363909 RepID=UPI0037B9E60D
MQVSGSSAAKNKALALRVLGEEAQPACAKIEAKLPARMLAEIGKHLALLLGQVLALDSAYFPPADRPRPGRRDQRLATHTVDGLGIGGSSPSKSTRRLVRGGAGIAVQSGGYAGLTATRGCDRG